ncbi:STM3941 family protein [Flavobacterium tistrianum]|uniref:STM3941 family protein n=1 Tax=Flavobacterium tistrianum TaxID=1685414 RepID=UPI0013A63D37|nr:STM3941 family protein [Flavobacterium tistrianum]KAF2343075.1 hypothetical protein DMB71_00455 [Flavobacterium tistrianum]
MKEIIIALDKKKLILLLFAGVVFTFFSFWFILEPSDFVNFITRSENIVFIAGILGLIVFGLGSVLLFFKLFDNTPGLIINEKGITDNSNSSSIGLIKWSDITEISLSRVMSTQFLLIKVSNPEDYIQKANQMKKLLLKQNLKTYGTPITITSVGLQCSFEDLEQMILESYNQNR